MIKNEREYKITKSQLRKFQDAYTLLQNQQKNDEIIEIEKEALFSQIKEIEEEIVDYENLANGRINNLDISDISQLPQILIKARILSGLTQKELADKLSLKEQQIQKYETTEYCSASFKRLQEVLNVLNLEMQEFSFFKEELISIDSVFNKLKKIGVDLNAIKRLLSREKSIQLRNPKSMSEFSRFQIIKILSNIFKINIKILLDENASITSPCLAFSGGFKLPERVNKQKLNTYLYIAHYLSLLVLQSTKSLQTKIKKESAIEARNNILESYGKIDLESITNYIWSKGIAILPLDDSGYFHGLAWKFNNRHIIIIKQKTTSESRWQFDLLHEYWHVCNEEDSDDFQIIDFNEEFEYMKNSEKEIAAHSFAANVLLNDKSEELVEECVAIAKGRIEFLKSSVKKISEKKSVDCGALSNYLAFRMSLQGINWWATAQALQPTTTSPFDIVRETLVNNMDVDSLNDLDKELLLGFLYKE